MVTKPWLQVLNDGLLELKAYIYSVIFLLAPSFCEVLCAFCQADSLPARENSADILALSLEFSLSIYLFVLYCSPKTPVTIPSDISCVCIQAWFLIGRAETVLKRVSSCQLQRTSLHTHKIQILILSLYKQDTISDFWQLKIRLWFKRSWTIKRVLFCDAVYCTLQDGSNFGVCG